MKQSVFIFLLISTLFFQCTDKDSDSENNNADSLLLKSGIDTITNFIEIEIPCCDSGSFIINSKDDLLEMIGDKSGTVYIPNIDFTTKTLIGGRTQEHFTMCWNYKVVDRIIECDWDTKEIKYSRWIYHELSSNSEYFITNPNSNPIHNSVICNPDAPAYTFCDWITIPKITNDFRIEIIENIYLK